MDKKDILEIRDKMISILIENETSCLCGRDEWCSGCSPSSRENVVFREVVTYFDELLKINSKS